MSAKSSLQRSETRFTTSRGVRGGSIPAVGTVLLVCLGGLASAQTAAPAGLVAGVGNFSHIVASLDRSVQFYRDVIGLEVDGAPRVFAGTDAMKVGNTPGAQSRYVTLKVPGSALGVEIIEFMDIGRTPAQPRFQDPGAANLILTVRDIDAIVTRVKKAGAHINTAGGVPATIQGGSRVMFVQDPDGFFVELVQPSAAPETTAPASSNIVTSGFEIMVADTDRTMRLYKDALGFDPQTGASCVESSHRRWKWLFDAKRLGMIGDPNVFINGAVA